MAKKFKSDPEWVRAKHLCRLNQETIRKAKELGFKPRALIKNIPNRNQPWKLSVKDWIEDLYEKKFASKKNAEASNPESRISPKKRDDLSHSAAFPRKSRKAADRFPEMIPFDDDLENVDAFYNPDDCNPEVAGPEGI